MFSLLVTLSVVASIDVSRYEVDLRFLEMSRAPIEAEVQIDLKATPPADKVRLDIDPETITIHSIHDAEGRLLIYSIVSSKLVVELAEQKSAESLTIRYTIAVRSEDDRRGFFFDPDHHGIPMLVTRNWPYYARAWLPSNDHPSDAAEFRFVLRLPPQTTSGVANGVLLPSTLPVPVWEQSEPIPTYAAMVAIGDLFTDAQTRDGRSVEFYSPPALAGREQYRTEIDKAADAVTYFSAVFGPYEFEKIGFVAAPHPFSLEAASMVVLIEPSAAVHEIIHHWWGNVVRIRNWGDFWISEGLTTYFTGFFDEARTGVNTACSITGRRLNVAPDQDPLDLYTIDPYCIGAAAIADYRDRLSAMAGLHPGDPEAIALFLAVFRRVYHELAFNAVDTREFADYLARATDRELDVVSRYEADAEVEEWLDSWFTGVRAETLMRRRAVRQ